MRAGAAMLLLGCLLSTACHRGPIVPLAPLETSSRDPNQDHMKIASFYVLEATRSRQMAEDQANRVLVYERLFGPESDWVAGARSLTQFYEHRAREQDRQARWHLELADRRSNR